ncbi:MAG: HAMP domain-containing histidine kinase [Scytonematopsis contorta HA4267-MV1]|nr:HAMP domain-containing histidine kinase [Scytonematopsis contorta HA4267-MV1]
MFQKTRYQLLLSYLVIFSTLLGIFALAVRFIFTYSLSEKLTENLTILGQNAASNAEFEQGKLKIESDFPIKELINRHQGLQWFDTQGNLVFQQGQYVLTVPLSLKDKVQQQKIKNLSLRSVTLPVIYSDDNHLIGYVRVSQSLSELDETLERLDLGLASGVVVTLLLSCVGGIFLTRKAMQPIEESFLRLKQFTADASHELRSPLMAITANVEVALENPEELRSKDIKKFKAIGSAADQMARLVEDLLLLARNDRVDVQNKEIVNLSEILLNLIELYQPQAYAKKINLKTDLSKKLYVMGDSVQLTRVFANLIENALQYTPINGTVEIINVRNNQQIEIVVKDTGIGMTPEQLQHIFERFWRADTARSYRVGGFGLGLAIAKSFVQNHGGTLAVTSKLNVGSCFTVSLPVYRAS